MQLTAWELKRGDRFYFESRWLVVTESKGTYLTVLPCGPIESRLRNAGVWIGVQYSNARRWLARRCGRAPNVHTSIRVAAPNHHLAREQ